jgi:outer membrane receptor protein involved in Fe transport
VKNTRISKFKYAAALQALTIMGAGVTAIVATPAVAQDYTSGAISGTVTDESGAPVAGAKVVVTSVGQGFERTVTTSADGGFRVLGLSGGSYNVTVTAAGTPGYRAEGVNVAPSVTQTMAISLASSGDEIVVTGSRVARDFNVATTGIAINVAEFAEDKPISRDLTSVILLAPGTTVGDDGFGNLSSIGGSSVAENAYYINGLNTTNFDNYLGSTQVPFEFYRSVDVKSGGYPAEFGRATGGIVNAVSKAGSNEFTGAVHLNWAPDFLRTDSTDLTNIDAGGVTTTVTNRSFDRTSSYSAILEAGGPIIKDRLFVYGLIEFRESDTLRTSVSARTATRRKSNDPFYAIKVDAYPLDNHHLEFTLFDARQTETQTVFTYLTTANGPQLGASRSVFENKSGGLNFVGKYTGTLTDWLTVSGAYGRVRDRFDTNGLDAGSSGFRFANASNTEINGVPNGGNFSQQTVTGRDLPYTTERVFYRADADLFFNALGDHHIRAGFDLEKNKLDHVSIRNGGAALRALNFLTESAFNANFGNAGAFLIARANNVVEINYFNGGGTFNAQNKSFYLQDEWKPTDRLTLNLGVRRDDFALDKPGGTPYIDLPENYAPRLAATYELWENNSGRAFASYSQYYLPVASNTAFRQASPELFIRERFRYNGILPNGLPNITSQVTTLAAYQARCPFALTTFSSGNNCNVTGDGTVKSTAESLSTTLKATRQTEWIVGYKHNFGSVDVGLSYTHRNLDSTAEDVAVDAAILDYCTDNGLVGCEDTWTGFHQYVIINPGDSATFALAGQDGRNVTISAADLRYPKAKRTYDAVELTVDRKWDGTWSLGGSYTWSRSKGNSEGFVQSDFEQDDSGITQDFDQPGFTDGASGRLPNDRTHRFKLFGAVELSENFTFGTNIRVDSPRSLSCFGFNPNPNYFDPTGDAYSDFGNGYGAASHYCGTGPRDVNGEQQSALAPRGKGFKTDWIATIDLSARINVPFGDRKVTLRGDVFNLLNSQGVQGRNEIGDSDIGINGDAVIPNPNYGLATGYQTPRSVRLGVDISF